MSKGGFNQQARLSLQASFPALCSRRLYQKRAFPSLIPTIDKTCVIHNTPKPDPLLEGDWCGSFISHKNLQNLGSS